MIGTRRKYERTYQLHASHKFINCDLILSREVVQMLYQARRDLTHTRACLWTCGIDDCLCEVWVELMRSTLAIGCAIRCHDVFKRMLLQYVVGVLEVTKTMMRRGKRYAVLSMDAYSNMTSARATLMYSHCDRSTVRIVRTLTSSGACLATPSEVWREEGRGRVAWRGS